ncbi:MAG: hypothetical protein HY855_24985 [Burkholderiales bacterium]|nr:hypothetical protein [Burkholderiales bacterium]
MPKPITDTLRLLQGGLFVEQCSELFAQVIRQVDETGKAGKLTITLDLKKVSGAIGVLAKVTDKTPEKAPDSELFYATVEGNLSRDNPNQRKLDLRVADAQPKQPVRQVDPETGEIRQPAAQGAA